MSILGAFAWSAFLWSKWISVVRSAKLIKSATEKSNPQSAPVTFGHGLRPKAREQNSATESRR